MRLTKFEQTLNLIYDIFEEKSISYAIIGGIAGIIHNLSRTTQDIDITLLTKISEIENVAKILLKEFKPIKKNPVEFFKKYFVFPSVCKKTGVHVDFAAGLSGFDKLVIERRLKSKFGNSKVYVCSIEDLIIYKLIANRTQDIADVEQLLNIHKTKLDIKYLTKIAEGFTEVEREDILEYIKSI